VNLDLVHAKSGSFDETGAGDLGLKIGSSTYNTAILTPEIEIGGRTDLKNGGVLRTFALAGVSLRSNDEWEGQASFNGGAHSPSFGMQAPLDRAALRLGTGVQLFATKQMDVQVRYDAELGSEAKSHNLTAKLAYHF
jgi:outer membrane autotransporter protein